MSRLTRAVWPLALLAAGMVAGTAYAEEPGSRQTREFVQSASQSDQLEIMEGQTALAQSRNPDVRAFATRMIAEHQRLSQALSDAAARSGLAPPAPGLGADQSQMLGALQSKTGEDFDKDYAKQQVLAHEAAITLHRQYAAAGDDPAIKEAVVSAIPMIDDHRAMALRMKQAMPAE